MKAFAKVPLVINCSSTKKTNQCNTCNSNKPNEAFRTKILETRKGELNSIFKTMDEISKKEMARIKVLFDDHMDYFKEKKTPIIVEGEIEDDLDNEINERYFEEK
jgi:hypothetical protein